MADQFIQGDVIITRVKALPEDAKLQKPHARGVVLAEGEVTGHAHVMAPTKVKQFMVGQQMFITVDEATEVQHEEHAPAVIPAGTYKVGVAREYDPFAEEAHAVAD